jgi:hypothetical protein
LDGRIASGRCMGADSTSISRIANHRTVSDSEIPIPVVDPPASARRVSADRAVGDRGRCTDQVGDATTV